MSSSNEEQELRELSERMGHLHGRENPVGAKRTKENPKGEGSTREEPRQKERKSLERGAATGDVVGLDPSRNTKFSQPEWKHPSAPSESSENCVSCQDLQEGTAPERGQKGRAEDRFITLC